MNRNKVENLAISLNYDVREISYKKLQLLDMYGNIRFNLHFQDKSIKVYIHSKMKNARVHSYIGLLKIIKIINSRD